MNKFIAVLIGTGLISISANVFSQTVLKMGHVDMNEIMNNLPSRDSAAAVLDKETKQYQATYDEMTVTYNKLMDDYDKSKSTFTEIVRKNKEAELLDKEKRLREFEQDASEALQKRNSELIKPIVDKILRAVEKVATENAFTYILDVSKGSVVFSSKDSQNINPLVMKILKP
jgi:outer membrane protein